MKIIKKVNIKFWSESWFRSLSLFRSRSWSMSRSWFITFRCQEPRWGFSHSVSQRNGTCSAHSCTQRKRHFAWPYWRHSLFDECSCGNFKDFNVRCNITLTSIFTPTAIETAGSWNAPATGCILEHGRQSPMNHKRRYLFQIFSITNRRVIWSPT